MSAFSYHPSQRSGHDEHCPPDDHDGLFSCDTVPPNRHAQRRGFLFILMIVAVLAVVGVVAGLLSSFSDIIEAFPSGAALLDGSAWDRFFAGLGRVFALAVACIFVVLFVRWRIRRKHRPSKPH